MRLSRGISSEMFLRLCTRAPCTAIVVRGVAFGASVLPPLAGVEAACTALVRFRFTAVLEAIRRFLHVKEGELLHVDVALLGEADGRPCLAEESLVRQVLACRGHAAHV